MSNHHGMKALSKLNELCRPNVNRSDRFGRIFPNLPALYVAPDQLAAIGAANGPMKSTGAAQKTDSVPVGHIFFGQFIDHDITLDLGSSFARLDRAEGTTNFRTPTLDLDCIYGDGPEGSPFLYSNLPSTSASSAFNGVKLLTGADVPGASPEQQDDLVRSPHGTAVIGDPRNDENRVISQLQLAMIRFHNKVADALHAKGLEGAELFEESRRVATWHYQWVVLNDFLTTLVGAPLVNDILGSGRRVYRPEDCQFGADIGADAYIPVEFSVAAYRFGHTMIPQRIQVQSGQPALEVFGPTLGFGFAPLTDLKGVVQWPQLLDLTDATVDRADKMDALLAADLLDLPFVGAGGERSLATRNLLRGQAFRLPSGEVIAAACDRPAAEVAKVTAKAQALAQAAIPAADLAAGTPLWLYVLVEGAEIGRETGVSDFDQGEGLGPVGGRIVAETLIGLMELDPHAYLGSNRSWTPASENLGTNITTLLDMLTF